MPWEERSDGRVHACRCLVEFPGSCLLAPALLALLCMTALRLSDTSISFCLFLVSPCVISPHPTTPHRTAPHRTLARTAKAAPPGNQSQLLPGEKIFAEADARAVVRQLRGRPGKAKQGKGRGEEEGAAAGVEEPSWDEILFQHSDSDAKANSRNMLASTPSTGCSEMPSALVESILWGCGGFRDAIEAGLGTSVAKVEGDSSDDGVARGARGGEEEDDDDDDDEEEEGDDDDDDDLQAHVCSAVFPFRFQGRARAGYAAARGVVEIAQEVAEAAFVIYHRKALERAREAVLEEAKELMRERGVEA